MVVRRFSNRTVPRIGQQSEASPIDHPTLAGDGMKKKISYSKQYRLGVNVNLMLVALVSNKTNQILHRA